MLTLSYGFKKPQTNDKGSIFWSALEANIQQLNDHNHNGTNSAKLTAASSTVVLVNILSAGWGAALADGGFRQLVTLPGTVTYDDIMINYKETSTGHVYFLQTEKVSDSTFYVYCNDASKAFKAVITT